MQKFDWQKSSEVEIKKCSNIIGQYMKLKRKNADFIVFFRLGEFYETYFEDAILISKECEIALTKRDLGNKNGVIPMAGVPYRSIDIYIKRLLEQNHKIAVCEQSEKQNSRGILEREVVRKYTSGTILDDEFLNPEENNYIAAIFEENDTFGLAYCELSTAEFNLTVGNFIQIQAELFKISPSELLVPQKPQEIKPFTVVQKPETEISQELTGAYNCTIIRDECYSNNLIKTKTPEFKLGYRCANAILNYVYETQKNFAPKFDKIKEYQICDYLILNENTRRNLELTKNIVDYKKYGSLFWAIDYTQTSMGRRLLKNWINQPLMNIPKIINRQNAVKELFEKQNFEMKLDEILKNCFDISRLSTKISNNTIMPKDFLSLKETLFTINSLQKICKEFNSPFLDFLNDEILSLVDFAEILNKTIKEEPNSNLKDGGLIQKSANSELEYYKLEIEKLENWFIDYENKLRKQTGAKNLKIGCARVFGYYIEVPASQVKLIKGDFKRKQTLSNSERFYTDILQKNEQKIVYLTAKANELEFDIYSKLREYSCEFIGQIREFAAKLAKLDVILSFYKCAKNNNYTCPKINDENNFKVINGRHPSVEKIVKNFTANNIEFYSPEGNSLYFKLLTGPNMAGKSTFMRQNAIIAILAQIGSFVPAENAEISVIDKIFVRIGSIDNLIKKKSTFMVEMLEVGYILENATKKSLILLDEIGKGTSTLDGVAIARAVSEYITQNIGAKTIFATHYHSLKILSQKHPSLIENLMINFVDDNRNTEPKRRVNNGFVDKSYGINVAENANLPQEVITLAQKYLNEASEANAALSF